MTTDVKIVNRVKNTTITVSTISLIVVAVLTVLFALLMISNGNQEAAPLLAKATREGGDGTTATIYKEGMLAIGAGIACTGLLGAGIGQGYAAGQAASAVGRNPEAEGKIRNMMIVGAAIAESSALYALVIAIMCLFVA